jgi:hypothetical protein
VRGNRKRRSETAPVDDREWQLLQEIGDDNRFAIEYMERVCLEQRETELGFWQLGGYRTLLDGRVETGPYQKQVWTLIRRRAEGVRGTDELIATVVREVRDLVREIEELIQDAVLTGATRTTVLAGLWDLKLIIQELTRTTLASQLERILNEVLVDT